MNMKDLLERDTILEAGGILLSIPSSTNQVNSALVARR